MIDSDEELPLRITVHPDPVHRGDTVQVCYDFTGLQISQATIYVSFDPPGGSQGFQVSLSDPCFDVTIPSSAQGVDIVDQPRNSQPWISTVLP
jgi:hypothetical protein